MLVLGKAPSLLWLMLVHQFTLFELASGTFCCSAWDSGNYYVYLKKYQPRIHPPQCVYPVSPVLMTQEHLYA